MLFSACFPSWQSPREIRAPHPSPPLGCDILRRLLGDCLGEGKEVVSGTASEISRLRERGWWSCPERLWGQGRFPKVGGTAFFSAPSPSLIYLGLRSHRAASLCCLCSGREDASAENLTKQWVPERLLCGQRWLMSVLPGWGCSERPPRTRFWKQSRLQEASIFPPEWAFGSFFSSCICSLHLQHSDSTSPKNTLQREDGVAEAGRGGGGRSALQNAPGRNCDNKTT